MSAEQAVAFLVFSFVAAITPGPSNLMLTAAGATAGLRRGLPCLAGVALGMGFLLFTVAMGLGHLALGHAVVLTGIKVLGAGFLLWLSWRIASSPAGTVSGEARPVGFREAAVFQWINPKSWLVAGSAAGTWLQADAGAWLQSAQFAGLFVAAALPSGFAWLAFGASMQRLLRTPRAARLFNVAMGLALAASVVLILR